MLKRSTFTCIFVSRAEFASNIVFCHLLITCLHKCHKIIIGGELVHCQCFTVSTFANMDNKYIVMCLKIRILHESTYQGFTRVLSLWIEIMEENCFYKKIAIFHNEYETSFSKYLSILLSILATIHLHLRWNQNWNSERNIWFFRKCVILDHEFACS